MMTFRNIQSLKISQVDDMFRVVALKDDVRHIKDALTLEECFEAMQKHFESPDYQERVSAYKASK